jgi:Zn-dependent protease with chaperone function
LAHEAGHVVARHSAEQLGFFNILLWMEFAVNLVFNARFITNRLFLLGGRLPYSRKLELEADYIGLMLLAKTCRYSVDVAPDVFETLGRAQGLHIEMLTTHPTSEHRTEALRQALPEARSAQAKCAAGS